MKHRRCRSRLTGGAAEACRYVFRRAVFRLSRRYFFCPDSQDWTERVIATSKLTKRFGPDILFEDVSVKFTPGNCYGLIGANGSGKTTFVKILAGLIPATHGEVTIGRDCTLGYLRQDHAEFDGVSILDTVY